MAWSVDNSTDLDMIVKAGPPPNDGDVLISDSTWSNILMMWAKYKKTVGDQQPLSLVQLDSCLVTDLALADYYASFFADSPEFPIDLPLGLKIKAKQVLEQSSDTSEADFKQQLRTEVLNQLWGYLGEFISDVKATQEEAASEDDDSDSGGSGTVSTGVTQMALSDIDMAKVEELNQSAVKALNVGESLRFVQAGDVVLLGMNHNQAYYPLLRQEAECCEGTLKMVEKGGAFSPGKLAVSGSSDTEAFKSAVRDFSKKKITFD